MYHIIINTCIEVFIDELSVVIMINLPACTASIVTVFFSLFTLHCLVTQLAFTICPSL